MKQYEADVLVEISTACTYTAIGVYASVASAGFMMMLTPLYVEPGLSFTKSAEGFLPSS